MAFVVVTPLIGVNKNVGFYFKMHNILWPVCCHLVCEVTLNYVCISLGIETFKAPKIVIYKHLQDNWSSDLPVPVFFQLNWVSKTIFKVFVQFNFSSYGLKYFFCYLGFKFQFYFSFGNFFSNILVSNLFNSFS